MKCKKSLMIFILFFISYFAFSQEKNLLLGDGQLWEGVSLYNVKKDEGAKGFFDLRLLDREYAYDADIDLLLHFNQQYEIIPSHYKVKSRCSVDNQNYKLGNGAAAFSDVLEPLVLIPQEGSLFSSGAQIEDFSIEFWVQPHDLSRRETILYWKNVRFVDNALIHQYISCSISDRFVEWSFINFFSDEDYSPFSVTVKSRRQLATGEWSHHLVSFSHSTGKLIYRVDGRIEDITYISANRGERSKLLVPSVGDNDEGYLYLGKIFYGQIDEFRISKRVEDRPHLSTYGKNRGVLVSRPIDLGYTNSKLVKIETSSMTPRNSNLFYYYRFTNERTDMLLWSNDNATNYRQGAIPDYWKPFNPGEIFIDDDGGRFLQILVEFYPDGTLSSSPSLKNMKITYLEDLPPVAPSGLKAIPKDGKVVLIWNNVTESDLAGYLIYFGESSGIYYGKTATAVSPIDVGHVNSYTVDNLENGKLYFFSIVAYDKAYADVVAEENFITINQQHYTHKSEFSKEVSARPSRIYGRN